MDLETEPAVTEINLPVSMTLLSELIRVSERTVDGGRPWSTIDVARDRLECWAAKRRQDRQDSYLKKYLNEQRDPRLDD